MTRVDTRSPPQGVIIKQNPKGTSYFPLILITALAIFTIAAYCISRRPCDKLDDSRLTKPIPETYSNLEGVDPEEREIFEGFRTSFLPADEVMLANSHTKSKREIFDENTASDTFLWGTDNEFRSPTKLRISRSAAQDYNYGDLPQRQENIEHEFENEGDIDEYESDSEQYEENEGIESIIHPQTHVDRGPLDDVVEQVRGQPELEEEEMDSSAHLYKPTGSYAGINAFWKGQGDKETIRATQAKIMRRYMDAEADPCHDFYQYACGNWAALNPIPADKAGYDTFEMLRENLDTVLKDLLEFKEHIASKYPGAHLVLENNYLQNIRPRQDVEDSKLFIETIEVNSRETLNNTSKEKHKYDWNNNEKDKTEIINRIRRFLNSKAQSISKVRSKALTQKAKKHRIKRFNNNGVSKYSLLKRNSIKLKYYQRSTSAIRRKLLMAKEKRKRSERETNILIDDVPDVLEDLSNAIAEDPSDGDAAIKAKFLFKSCMNYEILQKRGHQPLLDLLNLLGGWPILDPSWNPSRFDWLELMAQLRLYNNDILISEWVGPDIKNSEEFVIQFDQTSLGLPTRDYFLQSTNRIYLDAYKDYLIKIALLLGGDHKFVAKSADEVINFEIKLAKITSAPEDRKNVSELYRRMTLKELEHLVPELNWRRYLCVVMNRTVGSNETVVLFALTYVKHLVKLIEETDPSVLSNYLLWRFVRHRVNNLDDRFQSAKQQFYFILFGREQSPPRWKNCISQVNSNMGMALGSMFVKKYFDEMSKNDTLTMTREIQESFRELLHKTDWIDSETKKLAGSKVDAMMLRIGYPDFILYKHELDERYKEVKVHPDKYFENVLNILQHLTQMEQSRIGQLVNKTLWNTAPAVVNAYYSRNKNQIMFPAGILQPPFYHQHFPRSLNYGGIGVVIGHEITHGFDDKGRLFDCNGNLHRWWSDSAIEAFHSRAQCLIDQYGQYVVPEVNMKLNGMNTQGENIADNGGVKQAFRAYTHWVQKHGTEEETLPGLNHTNTQLFFLNFAQVWCGTMRPEAMRNKLKTAVHSPGRFRVIGTLSNSHDFAREFHCPPGSPMNPINKCTVW